MKKQYAVYLPVVGEPQVIEFKAKEEGLDFYYKTIHCDTIDIVNTTEQGYCLVVDDEGLFKETPHVNLLASIMYGVMSHGQPIVGDALLCADEVTEDGVETVGFAKEKASHIAEMLKGFVFRAED